MKTDDWGRQVAEKPTTLKKHPSQYDVTKPKMVSILYSEACLDEQLSHVQELSIIVDRLETALRGIDESRHVREELIAVGLNPSLVQEGLKYHVKMLKNV